MPPRLEDPPELLAGEEDLEGLLFELLTAGDELEFEREGVYPELLLDLVGVETLLPPLLEEEPLLLVPELLLLVLVVGCTLLFVRVLEAGWIDLLLVLLTLKSVLERVASELLLLMIVELALVLVFEVLIELRLPITALSLFKIEAFLFKEVDERLVLVYELPRLPLL